MQGSWTCCCEGVTNALVPRCFPWLSLPLQLPPRAPWVPCYSVETCSPPPAQRQAAFCDGGASTLPLWPLTPGTLAAEGVRVTNIPKGRLCRRASSVSLLLGEQWWSVSTLVSFVLCPNDAPASLPAHLSSGALPPVQLTSSDFQPISFDFFLFNRELFMSLGSRLREKRLLCQASCWTCAVVSEAFQPLYSYMHEFILYYSVLVHWISRLSLSNYYYILITTPV